MSPIKVMPLVLTFVSPFITMPGVVRAAEPQIILAQALTPQQQEEERKKKEREKQQEQQKLQQQRAQDQQRTQQQEQQRLQQQRAQDQQKLQQQRVQDQQKLQQQRVQDQQRSQQQQQQLRAQEEQKLQQQRAQDQQRAQQQKQAQEQQMKAQEQQRLQQQKGQDQKALEQQRAQDAARIRNEQAKTQQLQQQQRGTEQQLRQQQQQTRVQQNTLRRDLSAEEQKAKAARDAHQLDRQRLIAQQQQAAAAERGQAAVAERLRIQNERLRAISSQRQQSIDAKGQTIIREPGNRTIVQVNNHSFIQHNETDNFRFYGANVQTVRGPGGNSVSTIVRPDGVRLEVEVDSFGRPLRRVRIFPDGRRFVLFENRAVVGAGIGLGLGALVIGLAPPRIDIPREQYIVDAGVASEDDIYGALQAPPVEPLDRGYSLDEILASISLRERMRSISIDTIHFEFGSWELGPDQAEMLESVAAVIRDITTQNPGEVFLIEGHTDAVGSDIDNLSLSDRRAQTVAQVLSQQFGIPAENLVTQGYGKQFLLIPTDEPERRNRRVVIRRITPLLGGDGDRYSSSGDNGPVDQYRR